MAGLSVNSLMQALKQSDYSGVVTKNPLVGSLDRHHTSGSGGYHHYHPHKSHSKKGGKNVALSALTLLAFMVFLNLLQSCLEQQMDYSNNPQIVIMQARLKEAREEAQKRKGEVQIETNATEPDIPELRTTPPTLTVNKHQTKSHDIRAGPKLTQIPVKLKTAEKYQYP